MVAVSDSEHTYHVACPACGDEVTISTRRILDYWWGTADCDCGWAVRLEDHREDDTGALEAATRSQVATIKLREVKGDTHE